MLHEGESLSGLMEQALHGEVNRRRMQPEFFARGLDAWDEAERTGVWRVHGKEEALAAPATVLARHKSGTR